jgi:hypothetical protein
MFYVARQLLMWITYPLWTLRPGLVGRNATFTAGGRTLAYFYHRYNLTWSNERSIEIPIVLDEIARVRPESMLEVGNVLAHYGYRGHDVIDKYESAPGVLNEDVVDFRPAHLYDLIVSISTLEHVGWDERPRNPAKIPLAIDNLARCLMPGGRLILTVPIGYNSVLDDLVARDRIPFSDVIYYQRVRNGWTEVSRNAVAGAASGGPHRRTNALLVGTVAAPAAQ